MAVSKLVKHDPQRPQRHKIRPCRAQQQIACKEPVARQRADLAGHAVQLQVCRVKVQRQMERAEIRQPQGGQRCQHQPNRRSARPKCACKNQQMQRKQCGKDQRRRTMLVHLDHLL